VSGFDSRTQALRPNAAMAIVRSLAPFLVGLLVAVALQFWAKPALAAVTDGADYWAKILLDILTNVILAVSLTMVNGFTGQFSIGHAAFMAVGAYTAACIVYYASFRIYGDPMVHGGTLSTMMEGREGPLLASGDLLFLGAVLAGGLVASLSGFLVGLPSLRLKGDYLAIVTLGFGEIVRVTIQQTTDSLYDAEEIAQTPFWQFPKYVGGGLGFSGLPFYTSLFWVGLFASITLIVAFRLKASSSGRAFLSIREDEIAAESMGVHTTKYKVRAFVIAAFFAGIAGALFAHTNGVQLNPTELGFMKSFDIIIMVVLGGLGSISGAAIAAAILTILPEWLREPPSVWPGAVVLGVVFAAIAAPFARNRLRPLVVIGALLLGWEALRWIAAAADVRLSDFRMVLYAVMLVSMMIARPKGLLGIREVWDLRPVKGRWRL
jgi:branched-chain amino acid transport system permease protein